MERCGQFLMIKKEETSKGIKKQFARNMINQILFNYRRKLICMFLCNIDINYLLVYNHKLSLYLQNQTLQSIPMGGCCGISSYPHHTPPRQAEPGFLQTSYNQNQKISEYGQRDNSFNLKEVFAGLNPIFRSSRKKIKFPSPFIKYKIIPFCDEKKSLDVCCANEKNRNLVRNNLIIWTYHGGPNQLFYFKEQGNSYNIINVSRGFNIRWSEQLNKVFAHIEGEQDQQLWNLISQDKFPGCYSIVNSQNGLCLQIEDKFSLDGAEVVLRQRKENERQAWRVVSY